MTDFLIGSMANWRTATSIATRSIRRLAFASDSEKPAGGDELLVSDLRLPNRQIEVAPASIVERVTSFGAVMDRGAAMMQRLVSTAWTDEDRRSNVCNGYPLIEHDWHAAIDSLRLSGSKPISL